MPKHLPSGAPVYPRIKIKEVRTMIHRTLKWLMGLGLLALVCAGCGGSSPTDFPAPNGPTGSLILHAVWPQASREIPPEATIIDIEVTGEGLPAARTARIQRPGDSARIDNLPVGQKGISATARAQVGGPALAYGFATTVVEANKVKDVTILLGRTDQAGVAEARAMIQEARDAAVTLGADLAREVANQALVWELDLVPLFALTMQRLDFLQQILTEEHGAMVDGDEEWGTLTELPAGTYRAQVDRWGNISLEKIGEAPSPDTWVVQCPASDALLSGLVLTFKLTRKTNNLEVDEGEFEVVSDSEPQLLYQGQLTLQADNQNRVTQIAVNGTFRDKFLPNPGVTVQGTWTGTPLEAKSYSVLSFTGSLQSPKLTLTIGQATATFNPPAGAQKWERFVTKMELKDFRFQTQGVAEPVEATGELSAEAVIDQDTPEEGPLVKKGSFSGTYRSNAADFTGSIAFDWQNPQRELTEPPKGTASLQGRWAAANRPVFTASLTLTAASPFEVAIDLTRGNRFLRGKLTGDWEVRDGDLKVTEWSLNLQNEANLRVEYNDSTESGIIKAADGSKLADIQRDPDLKLVLVRYINGTLESLQPTDTSFTPHLVMGTVRGRVVDTNTGSGIAGAWVTVGLEAYWAETDGQGFFNLQVPAGPQTLLVGHWQYEHQEVEVEVPSHGEVDVGEIQLQPTTVPQ